LFSWLKEGEGCEKPALHSLEFEQILQMINAAADQEPEWMLRTGTLLVLDNNINTAQALVRRLSKYGHNILTAESEFQALHYLKSHNIDTILIDYQVFREDILLFLKKLEADSTRCYIPVIIIGAPENTMGLHHILDAGIGDYLAKPVNPVLLRARVQTALERKYAFDQRLKRLKDMQNTRLSLEKAIQDLPDGYAIFDKDNHLIMHNNKLFEFYPHLKVRAEMMRGGLTFEKMIEANLKAEIYHLEDKKDDVQRSWLEEKKASFILPASQWEEVLTNGIALGITTFRSPDGGAALIARDISRDKAQRQDMAFLAYHDVLTGLPNRKAFNQKLGQAIISAQNSPQGLLAVVFLDLDYFKNINDTHGHEMGDWILNQVSQRIQGCIRGDDTLARFGGDEFCIILSHVINHNWIETVASRIVKSVSEPFIRNGISMSLGVSIGIGIYSRELEDAESLLKASDSAMYYVKRHGKGKFQFYNQVIRENFSDRLEEPIPAKNKENRNKDAE
jgi:diguanylate cyclase (GGDEF)-like protein